jgi:hypothetical protein
MKVKCIARVLPAQDPAKTARLFSKMIRPLDLEFGIQPGRTYTCISICTREGVPWVYIASKPDRYHRPFVDLVPATLFEVSGCKVPPDWQILLGEGGLDIEMGYSTLIGIERWFERCLEEDEEVLSTIELLIDLTEQEGTGSRMS